MNNSKRSSTLLLWAGNILLGVLLSLSFLGRVSPADSASVAVFGVLGLVSSIGILSLAPGFVSILINRTTKPPLRHWFLSAVWTLSIWVLFIDTRLHGFYGFHINATVMGALFTPGIDESVSIGWTEVLPLIFLACSLLPAQAWFAARKIGRNERRWSRVIIIGSLFSFGVLQFWEAGVPNEARGPIAERIDAAPVQLNREPLSQLVEDIRQRKLGKLVTPAIPTDKALPNILVLVLDCLRADAIDSDSAPHLTKIRTQSRDFTNHLSGGNWTQHGIFSLIYGIHGSYWKPALSSQSPPPLISALKNANYQFRISAAAAQTFPAFRSTCWVEIQDSVFDNFPGRTPDQRDRQGAEAFAKWLETRETEQPFFGFFLLDATHQAYSFPPEEAVFTPYEENIRYIPISFGTDEEQRQLIKTRYRNSIHYADSIVASILASLAANDLDENTIVIITGDHGEEFWEHEIWGHATNFSQEQVAVPLLISGPGITPGQVSAPTSHVDIAPSLLELLGVDAQLRASYSLGESLFAPLENRVRVSAGWQGLGIRLDDQTLFLPTPEGGRAASYDLDWNRISHTNKSFSEHTAALQKVLEECSRFLEPIKND